MPRCCTFPFALAGFFLFWVAYHVFLGEFTGAVNILEHLYCCPLCHKFAAICGKLQLLVSVTFSIHGVAGHGLSLV